MYSKSVTYCKIENQEWQDDPFELGKDFVTGVARMSFEKQLSSCLEDLVAHYARFAYGEYTLNLNSLSDSDQDELLRLYIENLDRDVSECVYGDDFSLNNAYTSALLAMLKNNSKENQRRFAEVTRDNMLSYHSESLQEMIDCACDEYLVNQKHENGYRSRYDIEHGDVVWIR